MSRHFRIATRLAMTAPFVLAAAAGAAEFTVPGPNNESLKFYLESPLSPIEAGDTITLTPAGSYQTTYIVSTPDLTIRAAEGQTIVIDGQFAGTVFDLRANNITLEGLTIQNGFAAVDGGAIRCFGYDLTIRGCTFLNNVANDDGGAIVFQDAALTIEDSVFENNATLAATADSAGGAIQTVRGDVIIRRTRFEANESDGGGGAIHIADTDARFRIENCQFIANRTNRNGGALWWASGAEGDVFDSDFTGNVSEENGGAAAHISSPATYTRCRFIGNRTDGDTGDDGGALYISGETASEVQITSCLFANNTARSSGGAMLIVAGPDPAITNSTIVNNTALNDPSGASTGGGGVWTGGTNAAGFFRNCIVRGNFPDQFFGPANVAYCNVQGGFPGATNMDADPLFVDPANDDFRLTAGSPSVDAGDATLFNAAGTPLDLDDAARAVTASQVPSGRPVLGLYVDHGAYEFAPSNPVLPGCNLADAAEPFGLLDLSDITAFVGAFSGGCP